MLCLQWMLGACDIGRLAGVMASELWLGKWGGHLSLIF
jgi:hypothetical protein